MRTPCCGSVLPAPLNGAVRPAKVTCACGKVYERTELMSEILFTFFKREGECWHEWIFIKDRHCIEYFGCRCKQRATRKLANPNFFDPKDQAWQNFGWLVERATDDMLYEWTKAVHYGDVKDALSCIELAEALYENLN